MKLELVTDVDDERVASFKLRPHEQTDHHEMIIDSEKVV